MPDEREVLKEFIAMMAKDFVTCKIPIGAEYKDEFLEATKETEQYYFPGVIALHYNVYFFMKNC